MLPGITYDVVLGSPPSTAPHAVRDIAESRAEERRRSVDDFLDQGSAADHDAGWRARRQRRQRRQAGPLAQQMHGWYQQFRTRSCAVADESAKQQETLLEFPAISRSRSWGWPAMTGTGRADRCCQARSDFDGATMEMRASSGGKYVSLTCTVKATSKPQLDAVVHGTDRASAGQDRSVNVKIPK